MLVRTREGHAVFICGRGVRPRCDFPVEPTVATPLVAGEGRVVRRCPACGREVDTYETEDGRILAYRHAR